MSSSVTIASASEGGVPRHFIAEHFIILAVSHTCSAVIVVALA